MFAVRVESSCNGWTFRFENAKVEYCLDTECMPLWEHRHEAM